MDSKNNLFNNPWVTLGLPALVMLTGIQVLRALFPLLLYVLGDWYGWTAVAIGVLALIVFSSSFLAALLRKLLSPRVMLIVTVLGLGLCRLALQLWPDVPLAHLLLAIVGTLSLIFFFPIYLAAIRPQGVESLGKFGLGLQIGLILSVIFNGMYNTYEVTWQSGFLNLLLVLIIIFLLVGSLAGVLYQLPPANQDRDGVLKRSLLWLAFGPFLFVQMLLFINIAQLAATTGWTIPAAFALALLAAVFGFFGGAAVYTRGTTRLQIIGGGIFLLIIFVLSSNNPPFAPLLFLLGPLLLGEWFMVVILSLGQGDAGPGARNLTIGNSLAWLLFTFFVFIFYAGYQIRFPFSNEILPPLALAVVFFAGLLAIRSLPKSAPTQPLPIRLSLGAFLLILLLLVGIKYLTWNTPAAEAAAGGPVRVMTYNLHNGINPWGQIDLEALAQAIESENPDVIGLQEVSRGWVINGSIDTLQWFSQRLDMPYVWGPTEGENWGNAVLSRYPLTAAISQPLPPEDLLLHRGYISAEVETGQTAPLHLLVTHYHHITEDSGIRVIQSEAILDFWQNRPVTLLLGDLNAPPESPEMVMLDLAGFTDDITAAGILPGYTYPANDPEIRLDYIWSTTDLRATDVVISPATASDHLNVTGTYTIE